MRSLRLTAAVLALAGVAAVAPASASAVVTIGSSLGSPPNDAPNCGPVQCTLAQDTLITARDAPGGVTSPINGVVVRFRLMTGNGGGMPVRFRVVHQIGGAFTGAGTSTSFVPEGGLNEVPAQIRIAAGDRVGVDCCTSDLQLQVAYRPPGPHVAEGSFLAWAPPLVDGGAPAPSNAGGPDYEVLVNADVEPDADGDGFGDETQDACPTDPKAQGKCPPAVAKKKKKKCKKAKKKAAAAKKKKCKKRKKKG